MSEWFDCLPVALVRWDLNLCYLAAGKSYGRRVRGRFPLREVGDRSSGVWPDAAILVGCLDAISLPRHGHRTETGLGNRYGLEIRSAAPVDAPGLAELMRDAGHAVASHVLAEQLERLRYAHGTALAEPMGPMRSRWEEFGQKISPVRGLFDRWRSQGESNPCFRRERATS